MSYFYGGLVGNQNVVTRAGTKKSGLCSDVWSYALSSKPVISYDPNEKIDKIIISVRDGIEGNHWKQLPEVCKNYNGNFTSDHPAMRELLSNE